MSAALHPVRRSRPSYASATTLVVVIGLLWRSGILPLPDFLAKYGGDALWALVVFLCTGFVFNRSSTLLVIFVAVGLAWSIEFLQLYHAPWIEAIRSTKVGRLVLGSAFNIPDLFAYLLGIVSGAAVERSFLSPNQAADQILRESELE